MNQEACPVCGKPLELLAKYETPCYFCPPCDLRMSVAAFSALAASARLARSVETIEAWLQTKPRKSLEIFQSMAGFSVMPRQHDAAGRDYYADGFDDDDPGAAGPTLADALLALAARLQEPPQ